MKLTEVIDICDSVELQGITVQVAEKLKIGDTAKFDDEIVVIIQRMKREKNGLLAVKFKQLNGEEDFAYVSTKNQTKIPMSPRDKKTMTKNIVSNCVTFKDNDKRLLKLAANYYWNLSVHNNYVEKDVNELMRLFPQHIEQKITSLAKGLK